MKSLIARGLRRAATTLNKLAERLEPAKERLEAAQEAAQAAIERARTATVETVAEMRQEGQETARRGQEYASTSETKVSVYYALIYAWAFLEGMAWAALFIFLFGPILGFIASAIWSMYTLKGCTRRSTAFASYVFGLFAPRMEVNHA